MAGTAEDREEGRGQHPGRQEKELTKDPTAFENIIKDGVITYLVVIPVQLLPFGLHFSDSLCCCCRFYRMVNRHFAFISYFQYFMIILLTSPLSSSTEFVGKADLTLHSVTLGKYGFCDVSRNEESIALRL